MNEPLTNRGLLRTVLTLALVVFALFLIWRFVVGIASAVLVLLMGLFLEVALSGPVEWLHRHKIPRAAASVLILFPRPTDRVYWATISKIGRCYLVSVMNSTARQRAMPLADVRNGASIAFAALRREAERSQPRLGIEEAA